jgi:hypothetical protein
MKRLISIAIAGVAVSIASCGGGSTTPVKQEPVVQAPECVWPDAPTVAAPSWICDVPVEGIAVGAPGSAAKTAAGYEFQKQMAATAARVQLAQRTQVRVANMVKQYAEVTGSGSTETVDMVNTSVTKQITDQTLVGSRIYRSTTSPAGTVWVLMGIDEASLTQTAERAVRSSLGNDAALWQQFKAQKGQDELASEIAKQR